MAEASEVEPKKPQPSKLLGTLSSIIIFLVPHQGKGKLYKLETWIIKQVGRGYVNRKRLEEGLTPNAADFEVSEEMLQLLAYWEHCYTHGIIFKLNPDGGVPHIDTSAAQAKRQNDIATAQGTKVARIAGLVSGITATMISIVTIITSPDVRNWIFGLDWRTGIALIGLAVIALGVVAGSINAMTRSTFDQETISEANFELSLLEAPETPVKNGVPAPCAQAIGTIGGSGGTLRKATGQQQFIGLAFVAISIASCWLAGNFLHQLPQWLPWINALAIYLVIGVRFSCLGKAESWNRRNRLSYLKRITNIKRKKVPEILLSEYDKICALKAS